jgi:hypothetical protein
VGSESRVNAGPAGLFLVLAQDQSCLAPWAVRVFMGHVVTQHMTVGLTHSHPGPSAILLTRVGSQLPLGTAIPAQRRSKTAETSVMKTLSGVWL